IDAIHDSQNGDFVEVPDLRELGVDEAVMAAIYNDEKRHVRDAARDLVLLSGLTVAVVRNGRDGAFVHYETTLPEDLKPMVVCDASGRVRQTYSQWADGRGDLVTLQTAAKDYSNLTIRLWNRGGSKSAWKSNAPELIEAIARTV